MSVIVFGLEMCWPRLFRKFPSNLHLYLVWRTGWVAGQPYMIPCALCLWCMFSEHVSSGHGDCFLYLNNVIHLGEWPVHCCRVNKADTNVSVVLSHVILITFLCPLCSQLTMWSVRLLGVRLTQCIMDRFKMILREHRWVIFHKIPEANSMFVLSSCNSFLCENNVWNYVCWLRKVICDNYFGTEEVHPKVSSQGYENDITAQREAY